MALFLLAGSCGNFPPYYKCIVDRECLNRELQHGRCLMSAYGPFCAFPDQSCSTMWRWDEQAHPNIVNECVDPSVSFDAAIDAPIDMSTGS